MIGNYSTRLHSASSINCTTLYQHSIGSVRKRFCLADQAVRTIINTVYSSLALGISVQDYSCTNRWTELLGWLSPCTDRVGAMCKLGDLQKPSQPARLHRNGSITRWYHEHYLPPFQCSDCSLCGPSPWAWLAKLREFESQLYIWRLESRWILMAVGELAPFHPLT